MTNQLKSKHIDELFGKALDEVVPETWTTLNMEQLSQLKDKFAELIVRRCAYICDDIADPTLYREEKYHSRMAPGASYAAKIIRLRFGVEK